MYIEISKKQFKNIAINYINEHFTKFEFETFLIYLIKKYSTWYDSDVNVILGKFKNAKKSQSYYSISN